MKPMEFTVTIEDLRPAFSGQIYRRKFVAITRFDAIENAVAILRRADGFEEGSDYHIVDCR